MKPKIIILFFLFNVVIAYSQKNAVDSLVIVLNQTKNDIDKAKTLNLIANEYKTSNPKLMLEYATKALQLSQKIKYKIEEGNAFLNLGNNNIISGNYKQALIYFSNAQKIFETEISSNSSLDVKKGLAKAYGSIGIVFSEQSNYAKALQFYLKSVAIYEDIKDFEKCAKLYNNIGIVYKSQKSDFKALEYFVKAQKIQEKLHDSTIGITLTNIANCYLKQKSFDKAFDYYNKAKESLDKNPNPRALGEWYNNFGLFFKATKNNPKAIDNWKFALKTFETIDDKFGSADTYLYLGQLYLEQNKLIEAKNYAEKALALAKEIEVLEQIVISEKMLSEIYTIQNNTTQAFFHYKLYSIAKDSLLNEENTRKSVVAEMNYDYDKRDAIHKLELQKKEMLLKEQSKRNTLQLIFATLLGLLIFGIGFLIYSRVQLRKTLTLQKELAEYEQKALHLQMNPHFVFNCLGSISSFIVNNGTESAVTYLAKFSKLMRLTLEYSKESLIPVDKEIESLQNYLELEQLRFNHKFDFTITKSDAIEDGMAIPPLFIQPLVENAIFHGIVPKKEFGNIKIYFYIEDNALKCSILDNGIGVEASKKMKENSVSVHKSMAIDIINKRLEKMQLITGKLSQMIIEYKENGTNVILVLPIQFLV